MGLSGRQQLQIIVSFSLKLSRTLRGPSTQNQDTEEEPWDQATLTNLLLLLPFPTRGWGRGVGRAPGTRFGGRRDKGKVKNQCRREFPMCNLSCSFTFLSEARFVLLCVGGFQRPAEAG